jgi:hypothetical protein
MTEGERRAALSALDRIEARLGQEELVEVLPTGADVIPEISTVPDLIFWQPTELVEPSPGWMDTILRLLPAAGSVAAGFFRFPATTPTPVYGPAPVSKVPAPSTAIPWWGWALIGVGGLGAVGVTFAILRRTF